MRDRIFPRARTRAVICVVACTALLARPNAASALDMVEPAPAEPAPNEPAPAETAPAEPAPAEPAQSEPAPAPDAPATTYTDTVDPSGSEGTSPQNPPNDAPPVPVTTSATPYNDGATMAPAPTTVETAEDSAATDQLEGTSLEADEPLPDGVPERLPPLQIAGWWSTFAGVSLATAGGIFAGLAEREQNQAELLATTFDIDAGSRLLYEDVQSDYERHLRRGNAFSWTSRGFLIVGGAAVVSGIILFALHKKRAKPSGAAHLKWRGGTGMEVTF